MEKRSVFSQEPVKFGVRSIQILSINRNLVTKGSHMKLFMKEAEMYLQCYIANFVVIF